MLALCLILSKTYYAQNYAGIIGLGLIRSSSYLTIHVTKIFDISEGQELANYKDRVQR